MDEAAYLEMKKDIDDGELDAYFSGNQDDVFWLGVEYGQAKVKFEKAKEEK